MHIELSPKYQTGIDNLIQNLGLDAHTTNSFNAGGETIILASSKEDLQKILNASEEDFINSEMKKTDSKALFELEGLKAIIREQLK